MGLLASVKAILSRGESEIFDAGIGELAPVPHASCIQCIGNLGAPGGISTIGALDLAERFSQRQLRGLLRHYNNKAKQCAIRARPGALARGRTNPLLQRF